MKILGIHASPRKTGCTALALEEIGKTVRAAGLDFEIFHLGEEPIMSCIACGLCRKTGRCFYEDGVNALADACRDADGFVFGTPVHYAGANGAIKSAMGRLFFSAAENLQNKPAFAFAVSRRGGNVCAVDELQKFFTFNGMPIAGGNYWPILHGTTPDEIMRDEEGLQTLRVTAKNLCYLVTCFKLARENGILPPPIEEKVRTNFIR